MSNIVLITAGSSIAHYAEMLRKTLPTPENLSIVNCYMEEAVDYARNQLPSDTDVLIARRKHSKASQSRSSFHTDRNHTDPGLRTNPVDQVCKRSI